MPSHQSPFPCYEWPAGKSRGFCFTVDVDAESVHLWNLKNDQSQRILGPMERRIFGPRTGSWRLLDLLDRYGIKGTFFVPGYVAETYPELLPAFVGAATSQAGFFHEHASEIEDDGLPARWRASCRVQETDRHRAKRLSLAIGR